MTPNELLKTWLGTHVPSADDLLRAPSFKIPCNWGRQEAFISFSKPITKIVYAAQVAYGNEQVLVGIAQTAECQDFSALVSGQQTLPQELQTAVFEAGMQHTLLSLATDPQQQPTVEAILEPEDERLQAGLPFHLVTAEKEALIASGIIVPTASMVNAWANLDYLNPQDETLIPNASVQATCQIAQFDLPEKPEVGDHVILPELKDKNQSHTLTLILDNGIRLAATQTQPNLIALNALIDNQEEQKPNAALAMGTATVSYHQLLQLLDGQQDVTVPMEPAWKLWFQNQIVATGSLTELVNTPSFEVETITEDEQ